MERFLKSIYRNRSSILVGILRIILYILLAAAFFFSMSIYNLALKNLSRTLATTLFTYIVLCLAMHAVYGGFDVGEKKSRPVISSMICSTVITDLVTYVQLQIMNVNDHNNSHLTLFGHDFIMLLACIAVQLILIILFVRIGNELYFNLNPPKNVLLILDNYNQEFPLRMKFSRYRLQWHVTDVALFSSPDLQDRIANADAIVLGRLPLGVQSEILQDCYDLHKDIIIKADIPDVLLGNAKTSIIDDACFLKIDCNRTTLFQRIVKRTGDILVSLIALIITSPFFLIIAAAIKIDDHGPVFFKQPRLTIGGRIFNIFKFRTMSLGPNTGSSETSASVFDTRITHVGGFLRRFRLDELPQFLNVLKGDMSLVGPRPEMLSNIEKYKHELPAFVYREKVKAGMTGYAQIEGRYNTTAEDKLILDLEYIESFSIWLDVKLLLRTITIFAKRDSTAGFSPTQNNQ